MKIALLLCCVLPVVFPNLASAGITGIYKVKGAEYENGEKFTFAGTVSVAKKSGKYALKFNDGDRALYVFNFATPLKEIKAPQTVNCFSSLGTGRATFRYANGHYTVSFTYKAKNADVRGSGAGSK